MLALLTKNRALDKVQAAGVGEGLGAWRGLQERFTSMLLGILNGRPFHKHAAGYLER